MYVCITDKFFNELFIIDYYKSVIWTEDFNDAGEFEIYIPINQKNDHLVRDIELNYYVYTSERYNFPGIIRKIEFEQTTESGLHLILRGEMMIGILKQRIIYTQTNFNGTVINYIKKLINENMNPLGDPNNEYFEGNVRCWNPLVGLLDTYDLVSYTINKQFTYDNLFDAVKELCDYADYGFRIQRAVSSNTSSKIFTFDFYEGEILTSDQNENALTVFSFENNNLSSFKITKDNYNYITNGVVAGEGEGTERKKFVFYADNLSDNYTFKRFEGYDDASGISSNNGAINSVDYQNLLIFESGNFKSEHRIKRDAEVNVVPKFANFDLGDRVEIRDYFNNKYDAKVISITYVWDDNGFKKDPKLELLNLS